MPVHPVPHAGQEGIMTRWVVIPGGGAVARACAMPRRDWQQAAALVTVGAVAGGLLLALMALLGIGWAGDHGGQAVHLLARMLDAIGRVVEGS